MIHPVPSPIFIYAGSSRYDMAALAETLTSLGKQSTLEHRLVVLCDTGESVDLRSALDNSPFPHVSLETGSILSSTFLQHLFSAHEAGDAFFLKAGVVVPYAWDARLLNLGRQNAALATMSPLCGSHPLFSPGVTPFSGQELSKLDRLVFSLSARSFTEIPCFLPDCCWFSAAASDLARKALTDGSFGSAGWWEVARLFSARGMSHGLADCIVVDGHQPDVTLAARLDKEELVLAVTAAHPFGGLRRRVAEAWASGISFRHAPGLDPKPVQLHVIHGWGGGLERWARDYCANDESRINLVLKPVGTWGAFGNRLELYSDLTDPVPLRSWPFALPIKATALHHLGYQQLLQEIIADYGVEAIMVSSLIGHSLEVLETGLKTCIVGHDYYPFCPAITIYFDGICGDCTRERLTECCEANPHNRFFDNVTHEEWLVIREKFVSTVLDRKITIVAPTPSYQRHLQRLEPRLAAAPFTVIGHGFRPFPGQDRGNSETKAAGGRLRVLLLGHLLPHKGLDILRQSIESLTIFADVYLVGCGESGREFSALPHVRVTPRYQHEELPHLVHHIAPDVGLLLSICPETFSYTLSELLDLQVPVVATKVGSFADRIQEGVTGFLVQPDPAELVRVLRRLDGDRAGLDVVREMLAVTRQKTPHEMVEEYHRLLPLLPPESCPLRVGTPYHAPVFHEAPPPPKRKWNTFPDFLADARDYIIENLEAIPGLSGWPCSLLARTTSGVFSGVNLLYRIVMTMVALIRGFSQQTTNYKGKRAAFFIIFTLCFVFYYGLVGYRGQINNQQADGLSYFVNGLSILTDKLEISSWQEIKYDKIPYPQLYDTYPHQLYSLLRVFLYQITDSFAKSAFILLFPFLYLGALGLFLTARRYFSVFTSVVLVSCVLMNYRMIKIFSDGNTDAIALSSFLFLLYLSVVHHKRAYLAGVFLGFACLFRLQILSFVWLFPLLMHQQGDTFKTYLRRLFLLGACAGLLIGSFNFLLQQYLDHPPRMPRKHSWDFYKFVYGAFFKLNGGNFLLNFKKGAFDIIQPIYGSATCLVLIVLSKIRNNSNVSRALSPLNLYSFAAAIIGICIMPAATWSFLPGGFDLRYVAYAIPLLFIVLFYLVNRYCASKVRTACCAVLLTVSLWNLHQTQPDLLSFNNRVFGIDNWLHDVDIKKAASENFSTSSTILSPWARSYLFVPARRVVYPPAYEQFVTGKHNDLIDGLFIVNINQSFSSYFDKDLAEITDTNGNVFKRILYKPEGTFPTVIFKRMSKA